MTALSYTNIMCRISRRFGRRFMRHVRAFNEYMVLKLSGLFLMAILISGCSPKTVYIPKTVTEYIEHTRVDSLYVHDSVFVREYSSGDTVFVYKDRWHTDYRDRVYVDTVMRVDSIPYPVETVRTEVEYRTPKIITFFAIMGLVALILLAVRIWARIKSK